MFTYVVRLGRVGPRLYAIALAVICFQVAFSPASRATGCDETVVVPESSGEPEAAAAADVATKQAADPGFRIIRNLVYARRENGVQTADVYLPTRGEGRFPAVLLVHGGAWAAGHKNHSSWHARRLAMRGFVAIAIDYRLAPLHKFPAQLEDCQAALAWIAKVADEYRVDTNRIAAHGYSAGGHLVCLLALRQAKEMGADEVAIQTPRLRAVVAGGPPCELRDVEPNSEKYVFWLGATRGHAPRVYEQASPAHFVTEHSPPVFLFHGTRDRMVSKRDSELLHGLLTKAGVASELYLVPRAGHLRAFMDRQAFERSVKFLRLHLAEAPGPVGAGGAP